MPVDSKVGRRHWGWLILLVTFWKFQHFNLVSKIFQKLFKPLPCHKSIGKMLHAICISAVAVSLRWASCGPWASCLYVPIVPPYLAGAMSSAIASIKCKEGYHKTQFVQLQFNIFTKGWCSFKRGMCWQKFCRMCPLRSVRSTHQHRGLIIYPRGTRSRY